MGGCGWCRLASDILGAVATSCNRTEFKNLEVGIENLKSKIQNYFSDHQERLPKFKERIIDFEEVVNFPLKKEADDQVEGSAPGKRIAG